MSVAFAEKLRLVTSAVNQCVLCVRLHSECADWAGVEPHEIRHLLRNELRGARLGDCELVALLYAQHYAERSGVVDPRMREGVKAEYGVDVAHDIELILRLINAFNRTFNTAEAFLSRVWRRGTAENSNVFFEAFVTLLSAPITAPFFAYMYVKRDRFAFDGERE